MCSAYLGSHAATPAAICCANGAYVAASTPAVPAVLRVKQIRHLLGAGLPSEDIAYLLPCAYDRGPAVVAPRAGGWARKVESIQVEDDGTCFRDGRPLRSSFDLPNV
ncbi:hypothetical protein [Streptomyces sirii]|uniref:hypothetical protein n=1 Tax=Streptomyces sirii TaxID=3127701 RepID=UPI003D35DB22